MQNRINPLLSLVFLMCALSLSVVPSAWSADEKKEPAPRTSSEVEALLDAKFSAGKYSKKGADQCAKCHEKTAEYAVMGPHYFRTGDDIPYKALQCEACHGPAGDHIKGSLKKGELREPMITYGMESLVPAAKQNSVCLSCHANGERKQHWVGSEHDRAGVPCAGCHVLHQSNDPIQQRKTQAATCGNCHTSQLALANQRSGHPIRSGQLLCTECHSVHGSANQGALKQATINDNCYACHAEKRGPLLWEHEPVTEDCSTCHNPHGSINKALLTKRAPQLCQECHTLGHSKDAFDGVGKNQDVTPVYDYIVGQGCLNCHSQIHGSNHPSGNKLQR